MCKTLFYNSLDINGYAKIPQFSILHENLFLACCKKEINYSRKWVMLNDRTFYINTMFIFCVNGLSKKLQKKSFIILFMGKISPSNAKSYPHIHSLGWLKSKSRAYSTDPCFLTDDLFYVYRCNNLKKYAIFFYILSLSLSLNSLTVLSFLSIQCL